MNNGKYDPHGLKNNLYSRILFSEFHLVNYTNIRMIYMGKYDPCTFKKFKIIHLCGLGHWSDPYRA